MRNIFAHLYLTHEINNTVCNHPVAAGRFLSIYVDYHGYKKKSKNEINKNKVTTK